MDSMTVKKNPLKLNALQLKTLTLLQELAASPRSSVPGSAEGAVRVTAIPQPHGNHFHLGDYVVMARDASGLSVEGVWKALERKGLAQDGDFPYAIELTAEALTYDTGLRDQILHGSDH